MLQMIAHGNVFTVVKNNIGIGQETNKLFYKLLSLKYNTDFLNGNSLFVDVYYLLVQYDQDQKGLKQQQYLVPYDSSHLLLAFEFANVS